MFPTFIHIEIHGQMDIIIKTHLTRHQITNDSMFVTLNDLTTLYKKLENVNAT